VLSWPQALSPEACARLRAAVDAERQARCDSVDGAPDHQLNLSRERLESLVGVAATGLLWSLPAKFAAKPRELGEGSVEIFVRRYTPDSRPWIPFHNDSAAFTVNVALGDDASFTGGRLLACYDGAIRLLSRAEGEATVHASTLLHGVTMMMSGVRYSLILFFGQPKEEDQSFTAEMRQADVDALATLMLDTGLLQRCRQTLGETNFGTLRPNFDHLLAGSDVGRTVEKVVLTYDALHLRPVCILEREWKCDAACWSLYNLLKYAVQPTCYVANLGS